MSEKHTPKGWVYDEIAAREGCPMIVDAEGHPVADIRGWGYLTGTGGLNLPEEEAVKIQNGWGRQMAAAPDLLAALKGLMDGLDEYWSTLPEGVSVIAAARAAIAKAEAE